MTRLTQGITIAASREAVWRNLADFGGVAMWAPAVREAHCTTEARAGVGCARSVTASSGSTIVEVVTRWEEGRVLAFQVPGGIAGAIAALEETWSLEASADGCSVRVIMDYQASPGVFRGVFARAAVGPALVRMLRRNLKGLKRHVESEGLQGLMRDLPNKRIEPTP